MPGKAPQEALNLLKSKPQHQLSISVLDRAGLKPLTKPKMKCNLLRSNEHESETQTQTKVYYCLRGDRISYVVSQL